MKTPFLLSSFLLMTSLLSATSAPTDSKMQLTDLNYITSAGQSLSVGWTAKPPLKSREGLMFKGGVRPYEHKNDKSALVPLQEDVSPDGSRGETPLAGTVECFLQEWDKSKIKQATRPEFLCAANGIGGVSIKALKKGTSPFLNILDDLKKGKQFAEEQGKTFSMPAFLWTQGETDQVTKQTKDWYKTEMKTLISDLNQEAKSITGQKNDLLCFGYQVSSHLAYFPQNNSSYPTIALAQLELALEPDSGYIMTTPMYHFDYSDKVHLPAPMSKLYGAHIGYVMKKVLVDGVKWKPVHPVSHTIQPSGAEWIINLTFSAPHAPLTIDTQTVTDPGNAGFSVADAKGTPINIKAISLVKPSTVKISVEADPTDGSVGYGLNVTGDRVSGPKTGARGCLRDSQGDEIKVKIEDKTYRLDNWCPFFDYSLSKNTLNKKVR